MINKLDQDQSKLVLHAIKALALAQRSYIDFQNQVVNELILDLQIDEGEENEKVNVDAFNT